MAGLIQQACTLLFRESGTFGIDAVSVPNQAAECRLDMAARAAKAVVEIEVPERRIHVLAPEQIGDATCRARRIPDCPPGRWSPWPYRRALRLSWRCPWPAFRLLGALSPALGSPLCADAGARPKIKAATRAEAAERRNTRSLIGVWPSRISARVAGLDQGRRSETGDRNWLRAIPDFAPVVEGSISLEIRHECGVRQRR